MVYGRIPRRLQQTNNFYVVYGLLECFICKQNNQIGCGQVSPYPTYFLELYLDVIDVLDRAEYFYELRLILIPYQLFPQRFAVTLIEQEQLMLVYEGIDEKRDKSLTCLQQRYI